MVKGLQNVNLSEVARSAGVELRRSGNRYVGCCPIHDEKTPSFFVFPDNRFKCFGCGSSGDAIDFVRQLDDLSFLGALKHLGINQGPMDADFKRQIEKKNYRLKLIRRFRKWEMRKADELGALIRTTNKVLNAISSIEDFEAYGDLYHGLVIWEHHLFDVLVDGNDQDKFQLFIGATNDRNIQPG